MQARKDRSTVAVVLSIALLLSLATAATIVGTEMPIKNMAKDSTTFFASAYADTEQQQQQQCEVAKMTKITSSASTRSPENAIDDNLDTRWTAGGKGSWIKPDLGENKIVCYIDIMWYLGDSRIYSFTIYTSQDGRNWDATYSGKSSGKTLDVERYDFADTTARWVKVRLDGNQWNYWHDITELDVYTYSNATTATVPDDSEEDANTEDSDTEAPSVEITNPASNSHIISANSAITITVEGTASDDATGIRTVEVRVDGGAFVGATPRASSGDWSSWTAYVDLGAAGMHTIEARATDIVGNQASSITSIAFQHDTGDRTNPTIEISMVTINGGEITVQGTGSDSDSGIKLVEVRIGEEGAYTEATPRASGDWSSWTALLPATSDDTFSVTARATDNSGNQGMSSIDISPADIPPPAEDSPAEEEESPVEEPPVDNVPGAKKYFMATMLQYVNTDRQVDIYKPNMISSDKARIHVGLNRQVTHEQLDGLLSLPGSHGMEYFSLAEIKENAPHLKSKGIEFIDYDLEPGSGHSPRSDLADPVASIRAASKAAHDNGLLFQCSPSKRITTDYGAQLAQYCDQYHIQAQSLQTNPAQYESFVKSTVQKLRQNNPDIVISVQLSTQRESANGMSLFETMKNDFARVADDVDGVSLWFANNNSSLNVVESFAKWFDANYH